jgi:hypothetical protein
MRSNERGRVALAIACLVAAGAELGPLGVFTRPVKIRSKTRPQVFIIETLEFSNEAKNEYEGRRISDMLELSGKNCHYVYIRTKAELKAVLRRFWETRYRYLHLSCHANREEMGTTLDDISFPELGRILEPYLEKRRLFISACEMTCSALAKELIPKTGCYSILGPSAEPYIPDAAIFWASFYHTMFRLNPGAMSSKGLLATAQTLSSVFSIPLNYFAPDGTRFKSIRIRPKAQSS